MTSCPTCSLPAPDARRHCAFCDSALACEPVLARLDRGSVGHLSLATTTAELADCHYADGLWRLTGPGGTSLVMVPVTDEEGTEVTFFDSELNVVAGVRTLSIDGGTSVVLSDAQDEMVAVVRPDGAGGMHAVAGDGSVLLFAGRNGFDTDVLITDAGRSRPQLVLFALLMALEIEGIGPLHRPARSA